MAVTLRALHDDVLGFSLQPSQRLSRFSYPENFENRCKNYLKFSPPERIRPRFATLNFEGLIVYNHHKGPVGFEFERCTGYATLEDVKNWKTAIKCLQRYCLNLLLDPDRQDFHQINFSTGYYQYNIANNFKGAEKILETMGYICAAPFSLEIKQMKLREPKNLRKEFCKRRLARVLVDLVLFDFELDILVKCIIEYRKLEPGSYCNIMDAWNARKNTCGGVQIALDYLHCSRKFIDKPHMPANSVTEKILDLSALPPPDHGKGDEFGSVTQHINPSSHIDDDDIQLIKDSTQLGYRNPPEVKSQKPINFQPKADPAGYPPVTAGYRPPHWLPPNPILIAALPIIDQPTPEASQEPPDSKYGKTNLKHLKNRLQHQKVVTKTVVQSGSASPHSQSTSNYANTKIPYQGDSDNTTKPVAGTADLTSLRNRLENSKEVREKAIAGGVRKHPDYYNIDDISENPENPNDKKPMAGPQTVTPTNLASNNTYSAMSTPLSKKSYRLWQCAFCQKLNEAHHMSCNYCKVARGMADSSIFCDSCQIIIFITQKSGYRYTHCPGCNRVYEIAL